jgi:acetylornithine deacetylase/succinyl-diaminopimelate desuccinylase-like protein
VDDINDIIDILKTLVGFKTVANEPNLDLIDWVEDFLAKAGFRLKRIPSPCGRKAGLLAKFGNGDGGILYTVMWCQLRDKTGLLTRLSFSALVTG